MNVYSAVLLRCFEILDRAQLSVALFPTPPDILYVLHLVAYPASITPIIFKQVSSDAIVYLKYKKRKNV